MMITIAFDAAIFRIQIPVYADVLLYPDTMIQSWWDIATDYVSTTDYGYLSGNSRVLAINLLAAHLMFTDQNPSGGGSGILTSASEGSVSVSMHVYTTKSLFLQWLLSSPYGRQLAALLTAKAAGGIYAGGDSFQGVIRDRGGRFGTR
jgi:hypothetical protein